MYGLLLSCVIAPNGYEIRSAADPISFFSPRRVATLKGPNDQTVRSHIRIQQQLGGVLDRPNLMVMELISGATMLEGCPPSKAAELLNAATPAGRRRLRELGALVAMDALLNNSDRSG